MSAPDGEQRERSGVGEVVAANRETFETLAERDDRWGELARNALAEASDE